MATTKMCKLPSAAWLVLLVAKLGWTWALIPSSFPVGLSVRRYDSIFSFGDSFADTGNNPVVFADTGNNPVPGAQRELPARRQLRRRGRHRSRRRFLPRRQVHSQHQLGRTAAVVRVAQAFSLPHNQRVRGLLRQIPLLRGRIRGQRLPLLLPHQERARDHVVRSRCHQDHLNGHREADQVRGDEFRGSWDNPVGMHAAGSRPVP